MKNARAMAVEDARGIPGRARRVAQSGRGALVQIGPAEHAVLIRDQFLVAREVATARGHVRPVRQHDEMLDRLQLRRDLLDQRHEAEIKEQRAVFGVIGDVDDLLGK